MGPTVTRLRSVLRRWVFAITRPPRGITLAERACGEIDRLIRRECLDHIVVFGEAHLRRIFLAAYTAGYYKRS